MLNPKGKKSREKTRIGAVLCGLTLLLAQGTVGHAASFLFDLSNHPDGNKAEPYYGLRLDKLYDVVDIDHEIFTFDFNHEDSNMQLMLNTDLMTARIFGTTYGGLDTGEGYGNPDYRGLWEIDFTYRQNLEILSSGGFIVNGEDLDNNGTITPLFDVGGDPSTKDAPIGLWDEQGNHTYSYRYLDNNFRLGGTDLDGTGVYVGNGWLNHGDPNTHVYASDWLHTGNPVPTPEPSTVFLMGSGLAGLAWLRSRKQTRA